MDLATRIESLFREEPDAAAVQYEDDWFTWADLRRIRDEIEAILAAAGVGPGEAVGLVVRERPSGYGALLALLSTRRCAVLVSPLLPEQALTEDVQALSLPALVADAEDWASGVLGEAASRAGTVGIELTNDGGAPTRQATPSVVAGTGTRWRADEDVAVMILTSGTTGLPRRVPLGREHLGGTAPSNPRPAGERGVAINAIPLASIGGVLGVVDTVWRGRPLAVMDRFDVMKWVELVRQHRPRRLGAPPATLRMLLDRKVPREHLSSAKFFMAASAPLDPQTSEEFEAAYGIPVLTAYGATEFLGATIAFTEREHAEFGAAKRGSVGRPLPGVKVRVVDEGTGIEMPCGEPGILEIQSLRRPAGTPEGWTRTTDIASVDADGFVWIHGRADGVVVRGGFKVSPTEVEDVLRLHPAVSDASVVGLPDPRLHEVPAAAVTLHADVRHPEPEELMQWVRRHKPPYCVPVKVAIVDELPRNAMLKVVPARVRDLLLTAP